MGSGNPGRNIKHTPMPVIKLMEVIYFGKYSITEGNLKSSKLSKILHVKPVIGS